MWGKGAIKWPGEECMEVVFTSSDSLNLHAATAPDDTLGELS